MFKGKNIFFIFIGLIIASCGYRFTGGGDLPGGIKSVYVKTLENRTSETGIENFLTDDIIYEFTRSGKAAITEEENAEAVLTGAVSSLTIGSVSRHNSDTSSQRRVRLGVDLKLTGNDGMLMWAQQGIMGDEDYNVSPDKSATEYNKREAIKILSKKLAEKVYNRLTDNF
ncbi:MAG: hypothetical protein JJV92_10215 [Desulfosarcina sp.]|nr:hypothetical protein [Desulfobacterales bacterium]